MSGLTARLDKLAPALSAKERAMLVLHACKQEVPENPKWRRTMPRSQKAEFNRLIDLINGCNLILGDGITDGLLLVEQLEARLNWVLSTDLYRRALDRLALYVLTHVRESIAESDYALGVSQSDRVRVLKLIDRYTGLAGERTLLHPDDPTGDVIGLMRAQQERLRSELQQRWRELRAFELVVADVAQEFDGEDPLQPVHRADLDQAMAILNWMREPLGWCLGESITLPEPDADDVEQARGFLKLGR